MSPEDSLPKVRLVDTELHYKEVGAGPTVVLVHGGLGDYRQWGSLSAALSDKFRVVSYSRRGAYPNKPLEDEETGIPQQSADLASLISSISKEPVHLVAESYGAFVATHCAIHYPEKVSSLCIDEPPILPLLRGNSEDRDVLAVFENDMLAPMTKCLRSNDTKGATRIAIGYLEGSSDIFDQLPIEVRDMMEQNRMAFRAEMLGGFDWVTLGEVRRLKVPTLLMKSEHGPVTLKRIIDVLHEAIPHSVLREIKGTSHGTIIDSPEYASTVKQFMALQSGN